MRYIYIDKEMQARYEESIEKLLSSYTVLTFEHMMHYLCFLSQTEICVISMVIDVMVIKRKVRRIIVERQNKKMLYVYCLPSRAAAVARIISHTYGLDNWHW